MCHLVDQVVVQVFHGSLEEHLLLRLQVLRARDEWSKATFTDSAILVHLPDLRAGLDRAAILLLLRSQAARPHGRARMTDRVEDLSVAFLRD